MLDRAHRRRMVLAAAVDAEGEVHEVCWSSPNEISAPR